MTTRSARGARAALAAALLLALGAHPACAAWAPRLKRRGGEPAVPTKPSLTADAPFHARPAADCVSELGSSLERGLDEATVAARREEFGPNALDTPTGPPLWRLFLDQLDDALVKVLLVTAAVSLTLAIVEREEHGWVEPFVIVSILALNAIVGVWQEVSAQGAVDALKKLTPQRARVLRNGRWDSDVAASELVPGDVIECRVGDRVPADCRVLELKTTTVRAEESSLTGESTTVEKVAAPVDADAPLAGRQCCLYASTTIASGAVVALVLRTGMGTEIGKIQQGVQDASGEQSATPLALKLEAFGKQLTVLIGLICIGVWALSIPRFGDAVHGSVWRGALHHFKASVALGVAAIPEGLPAVITLCLSLGTRRMAQRNAIVRKLPSVETLGCTTVICSDKTGTLTTNQMTVVKLVRPSASRDGLPLLHHDVSGTGYATNAGTVQGLAPRDAASRGVRELAAAAALSNDAQLALEEAAEGPTARGGRPEPAPRKVIATGEPTEAALLTLAGKLGRLSAQLSPPPSPSAAADGESLEPDGASVPDDPREALRKVATLEFTRARKSKSALVRDASGAAGSARLLVKGAPDTLLPRCTEVRLPDGSSARLDARARREIQEACAAMGKSALRCIALAVKPTRALGSLGGYDGTEAHRAARALKQTERFAEIESGLTFLGLVGIRDPPRPSVGPAIASCRAAGVRVMMMTGDSKETAQAVAKDVGIFRPGDPLEAWTFVGKAFFELPEAQQHALLRSGNLVFCRTEPADKQKLVRMLASLGEVTAMTGDGVNDAPALRQAAIGVAMGIAGTEVSKEASDMVLADDNFATIVAAVEEGRSIYANMKAFIHYLITCNIGEVCAIVLATALGLPEVLSPLHLLWVNLVTDGPPATALGFNPPEKGLMAQKPRGYTERLIPPFTMLRFALTGVYIGGVCVGSYAHAFAREFGVAPAQLLNWRKCASEATEGVVAAAAGGAPDAAMCALFAEGSYARAKASSVALSVLVTVECIRAFAAISEKHSLLQVPPWANPYLGLGMLAQVGLHSAILYVPKLRQMFKVRALDADDWRLVLCYAAPVLVLEEALKLCHRWIEPPPKPVPVPQAGAAGAGTG